MKIFIDTANTNDIIKANEMGVICGVTTNPSLIAKEGRNFREVVTEICAIVNGPISAEVVSIVANKMVEEAMPLVAIHPNIVIKVPMTGEGLKAVKLLSAKGIKTNVTLVFSSNQALLAARAGASYVSPFIGRLEDINEDGIQLIEEISTIFNKFGLKTEIIAASIRTTRHATLAALAGANIGTMPYSVIAQMLYHPLTDTGISKFLSDWETVKNK